MIVLNNNLKVYPGIDYFKLIAAFMVVMIHTRPFTEFIELGSYIGLFSSYVYTITNWGVPFFFCCSGFFFHKQLQKHNKILLQIKRLFIFYLIWSVIYAPIDILMAIIEGKFTLAYYLKKFFILGSHFHLWYIPALIISIYIIYVLRNHKILLIYISLILFIMGVIGGAYYNMIKEIPVLEDFYYNFDSFEKIRRIFYLGLPFTYLGYLISSYIDSKKIKVNISLLNLFLLISSILYFGEIILIMFFKLQRDIITTFFLLFLVTAIFFKGLSLSFSYKHTVKTAYTCRLVSNCIYFVHPLVIYLLNFLIKDIVLKSPTFLCISTFVISGLIGLLIMKINNPKLNMLIK